MLFMGCAVLASGCVVREVREPPPPVVYREPPPPPPVVYQQPPAPPPSYQPAPAPVAYQQQDPGYEAVSVEPPMDQPAPVAIPYAPPPMLWDPPPPQPYYEAVWVGGHWTWWNGEWVWARGHWARPPNPSWVYSEPYYEYRGDAVVFVAGFWRPAVRVFVPPPPTLYIPLVQVRVVHVGYARPIGPHGVFVPPPPGSQPGVIVPCPVGTSPAVVLSAPPVVRPGMVVRPVSRPGVVEVYAPAGVTREGRVVTAQAPAVAHEAAAVHPVVVAPVPIRAPDRGFHEPAPFPGPRPQPATVGGAPVANPVPAPAPATGTVTVRQPPPPAPGQAPVQPVLRPETMGSEQGKPRPWSNGEGRGPDEGPVLRPVQSSAHPAPVPPAPIGNHTSAPPVAQSAAAEPQPVARRAEPPPRHPPASKKDPEEKKKHSDSHER
jgi:hypothetical protein